MYFHLTDISSNKKTGPIPVSTVGNQSCPDICPLKKSGCYGDNGPLAIHWSLVSEGKRGGSFEEFLTKIKKLPSLQLWRHSQAGDLPGEGDVIDAEDLIKLVEANKNKKGYTYTHKPVIGDTELAVSNRAAVLNANQNGFTINLSGNNPSHADKLADTKCGPVVTLVPKDTALTSYTPAGRKIIICPAQREDLPEMNCARCKLCAKADRTVIVGFLPHGKCSKKANAIACEVSK